MSDKPFEPYWRKVHQGSIYDQGQYEDPYSWVFFVVAKISGQHQPLAIVSSSGSESEESLRGQPLVALCQRLVTIFSTKTNHPAIQAEMNLAKRYNFASRHAEQHDLPETDWTCSSGYHSVETNQQRILEFPFISTCLLQGVKWNPYYAWCLEHSAQLEPLNTVYRDISIAWGMVVVDITDLDAVAYGIVGFKIAKVQYVSNKGLHVLVNNGGGWPVDYRKGALRVAESPRARRALSASEYLAKFQPIRDMDRRDERILQLMAGVPVVSHAAMNLIWPLIVVNVPHPRLLPDLVSKNVPDTVVVENSKIATMEMRVVPDKAYSRSGHLKLESSHDPLSTLFFRTMDKDSTSNISSISLCLDDFVNEFDQLIASLLSFNGLHELYIVSSPNRINDDASIEVYHKILATGSSSNLCKSKLIIAGLCSIGGVQQTWLPSVLEKVHFQLYPIQQVLFVINHRYYSSFLSDALLPPERFVSGFLNCLGVLAKNRGSDFATNEAHLFVFSSCCSSLGLEPLSDIEISLIPAEGYMTSEMPPYGVCLNRDLTPESWTVLVKQGTPCRRPAKLGSHRLENCLQYAFVRPRQHRIAIEANSPLELTPDDLEVLDIYEFLSKFMSTEEDSQEPGPSHRLKEEVQDRIERLAPMGAEQILDELPTFLNHARAVNRDIVKGMKERGITPHPSWLTIDLEEHELLDREKNITWLG